MSGWCRAGFGRTRRAPTARIWWIVPRRWTRSAATKSAVRRKPILLLPPPCGTDPPSCPSTEDCSSGRPATCNLGCARVVLPFFADCGPALGPLASAFNDIVGKCQAATGTYSPSPPSSSTYSSSSSSRRRSSYSSSSSSTSGSGLNLNGGSNPISGLNSAIQQGTDQLASNAGDRVSQAVGGGGKMVTLSRSSRCPSR